MRVTGSLGGLNVFIMSSAQSGLNGINSRLLPCRAYGTALEWTLSHRLQGSQTYVLSKSISLRLYSARVAPDGSAYNF